MIFFILFIIIFGAWAYSSRQARLKWQKKGVPQTNLPFLLGQIKRVFSKQESSSDAVLNVYNIYPNKRYIGFYQFNLPVLMITDPDLLKQLTVKDFDHFTDRLNMVPDNYDPLFTRNLFARKGNKWTNMRTTLTPAFTTCKMKAMFMLMSECSENFTKYFLEINKPVTIELKDTTARFANDVIISCAYGVKCDSLKDRDNDFYRLGNKATDFTSIFTVLKLSMFLNFPEMSKLLGLKFFPKDVTIFFEKIVKDTVKIREKHHVVRPDMINLLMEARKERLKFDENQNQNESECTNTEESDSGNLANKLIEEITDEDMVAQALLFFFAGFDTASTAMSFMGYELAINPDIQNRLKNEIDDVLEEYNGNISYEAISKMKYLDMVVSESLRKWPPLPGVDRACVKRYTIKPILPDETEARIDVGEALFIPIWAFHHDPKYFPNPDKFDPERFSDENKHNIKPYTFVPFGVGPRNCIGSRFAILEIKILFVNILSKLELYPSEKTTNPIRLKNGLTNILAEDGFWVGLKPRSKKISLN